MRKRLIELLSAWEAGAKDETQVRDEAEALELAWPAWQVLDEHRIEEWPAGLRATEEILSTLADLHIRWVTRDDIPAMRASLDAIETDPKAALASWIAYGETIDWARRGEELRDVPFYAIDRG
jgi:hypothetical protein